MTEKHERDMRDVTHRLEVTLTRIEGRLDNVESNIVKKVNTERFSPVEKIVYGLVALILAGIVGAGMKGLIDAGPNEVPRPRITQQNR